MSYLMSKIIEDQRPDLYASNEKLVEEAEGRERDISEGWEPYRD